MIIVLSLILRRELYKDIVHSHKANADDERTEHGIVLNLNSF